MSTKIYNGYRLPAEYDILNSIHDLRVALQPIYTEAFNLAVGVASLFIADTGSLDDAAIFINGDTDIRRPRLSTLRNTASIMVEATQLRLKKDQSNITLKVFDLDFEVCYLKNTPDGHRCALLFGNIDLYAQRWAESVGAREYGYWNNTDQPDGVSDGNWDRRRRDWDFVLPESSVPADECLTWNYRPISSPANGYGEPAITDESVIQALRFAYDSGDRLVVRLVDSVGLDVFTRSMDDILTDKVI